jgi:hypothetical protein
MDVDGHNFPNLALMKISAWHKKQGDDVEMFFGFSKYDKVYMSKVFDFTPDFNFCINSKEIIKGGTGYDLKNVLPHEIETIYPDYGLYNIKKTAYGFLTRGCPRGCGFCIVGKKEGLCSYKVADLKQFWNGQKEIKLLDPNLLASKDRLDLLDQLIASKAWIDFTQGLDARLLNNEVVEKIKNIKVKMIHFAWDFMDQSENIVKNLELFRKNTDFNYRKLKVYVLTNYDTTMEENLYRIHKLKGLGFDPYVMVFEKWKAPKEIKMLQRWVNNKFIFRSCETFKEYQKIK